MKAHQLRSLTAWCRDWRPDAWWKERLWLPFYYYYYWFFTALFEMASGTIKTTMTTIEVIKKTHNQKRKGWVTFHLWGGGVGGFYAQHHFSVSTYSLVTVALISYPSPLYLRRPQSRAAINLIHRCSCSWMSWPVCIATGNWIRTSRANAFDNLAKATHL